MARLYIRHEPTDIAVSVGTSWYENGGTWTKNGDGEPKHSFHVVASEVSEIDNCYVCFVHEGKCWAARGKNFFKSGQMAAYVCVPFNDDPSGKLMLLKDTLLG